MGVEALWSSKFVASNAAMQHLLPSPVVIDLVSRDAGVTSFARRSSKVARVASRGWNMLKSLRHHGIRGMGESAPRSSSSFGVSVAPFLEPASIRSADSSAFICRAKSYEQTSGPLPEREDADGSQDRPDHRRGVAKQPEAGKRQGTKTMVSFKYGGGANIDGFRSSPSPDFSDEFFTRMMALEASHNASPRVIALRECLTSSLDAAGADANGASESPRPSPGHGDESSVPSTSSQGQEQGALCALGMGGVQLPSSIKKLRRRNSEVSRASDPGCAIQNAFSSMVYMIKVVQSHALQIRQLLFSEWDAQEVLLLVHREMHSSFLWLFQQVFACTPTLMVSVMILLANFTVFSMGENVAIATETPTPIAFFLSGNPQAVLNPNYSIPRLTTSPSPYSEPSTLGSAGSGGNRNFPSPSTAESFDGDSWLNVTHGQQRYMLSQKDVHGASQFRFAAKETQPASSHLEMMKAWVEIRMKDLKSGDPPLEHMELEQETIRRLVAPVVAHLESDNYACFDRTDLEYQHALSKDPANPLLLANYAQFLYVVRHDNDRAEGYFHQAMEVDPLDSTILGRFASFLWLGRGNRAAAERAYKAAMAADPESSFPAGNYAHFLWHVGDGDSPGAKA